jgi:hypothetical protein
MGFFIKDELRKCYYGQLLYPDGTRIFSGVDVSKESNPTLTERNILI